MKTAAAYIRVSTDRQEELSPDAQKRELKNYARKNGIVITDFFQDNGISGRKAEKRPEFQKMISLAKSSAHPYDIILVWKYSRFARNQEESIVYKSLLQKNSVEVVSITEPLIDGPFSSLIERIIEWMDEYYSIRLSGDVKRGMTEKALRGGYQSVPPLGYHMNDDHIPEIYESEAVIVREAFRLCKEKYTITTIARMLNDAGYRTRRGNRFERRTILYILQNPFYAGMVRWNRAKHSSYQLNNEEDIIVVEGVHEPLFTKDYFDDIQTLVSSYTPGHTGLRRRKSDTLYKHYLCGIIKCPICGKNLAYHCVKEKKRGNKTYPHFVCWQYSKGIHKTGGNISSRRCEEALKESLQTILDAGAESIDFHPSLKKVEPSPLLEKYKAAITKLEQKERRIREAYIDGIDTKEEYRENKLLVSEERKKLERLIANEQKNTTDDSLIHNAKDLILHVQNVLDLINDPEADTLKKHQALETILEKMEYQRDTDTFRFYYLHT
ncbi:MAG: recombinase family protein [Ruminococcus flavefaciens]|nr:recombinase family protein [Ruminococcus flavefaciens]